MLRKAREKPGYWWFFCLEYGVEADLLGAIYSDTNWSEKYFALQRPPGDCHFSPSGGHLSKLTLLFQEAAPPFSFPSASGFSGISSHGNKKKLS